jgi:hypothetical protein
MELIVDSKILWAVFLILVIVFAIFIPIFNYHWNKYGVSNGRRRAAQIIYFGVSAILLVMLATFILIYSKTNVI